MTWRGTPGTAAGDLAKSFSPDLAGDLAEVDRRRWKAAREVLVAIGARCREAVRQDASTGAEELRGALDALLEVRLA
jgi:hypothetical protein